MGRFFNWRKKDSSREQETFQPQEPVAAAIDYFSIGRDGTPEEIAQHMFKGFYLGSMSEGVAKILTGAKEALKSGRPQNMAACITNFDSSLNRSNSPDCQILSSAISYVGGQLVPGLRDITLEDIQQMNLAPGVLNKLLYAAVYDAASPGMWESFYARANGKEVDLYAPERMQLVRYLLAAGADPNCKDGVLLRFCVWNKTDDMAELLYKAGAKFEIAEIGFKRHEFYDRQFMKQMLGQLKVSKQLILTRHPATLSDSTTAEKTLEEYEQQVQELTQKIEKMKNLPVQQKNKAPTRDIKIKPPI